MRRERPPKRHQSRSSVVAPGQHVRPGGFDRRPARRTPLHRRLPGRRPGARKRRIPIVENETHYAEAVIDNGSFGTRTIRFETGRLARQAAGSAAVYLDGESMLLSTTTAGKTPK